MAESDKTKSPLLSGRIPLYSRYNKVDRTNIEEVLREVMPVFLQNQDDIEYLMKYRRGIQPILNREKTIRNEIKNIVVKNEADQIVNFKTGYLLGEPIQFVARKGTSDREVLGKIDKFNNYCYLNKKSNLDKELADYMYTCGTAYRMVLPNDNGPVPFGIYNLDPRFNAVVYSTNIEHTPLFSITEIFTKDRDGNDAIQICCYTPTSYFVVASKEVEIEPNPLFPNQKTRETQYTFLKESKNPLGKLPVIEYPLNPQRMGGFESVITLMDAINTVESNRVDAVEQVVQSIMVFYNLDVDSTALNDLQKMGAITLTSSDNGGGKQDVKYLSCDLNQSEAQTIIKDLEEDILTICGLPNRNGGSSTSDTGSAVIMRDGWSDAEARAKEDELSFKASEMDFLNLALQIMANYDKEKELDASDIDIIFTRKNYENIAQKTTVLTQLLGCDKVAPALAFEVCNMFNDPQRAYEQSMEYYEGITKEDTPSEQNIDNAETN